MAWTCRIATTAPTAIRQDGPDADRTWKHSPPSQAPQSLDGRTVTTASGVHLFIDGGAT